ncbi:circumsporozoite protein-like isoform X1 [Bactrocera dorsalis]|uniref:Circumsporozoite protein-like isoform X1 n=1 Tax=Bactrocera dorsalis TaxID=27457 RepID=A0ABM3JT22_BACDO|nr:circumsporozoite protein-like isoform X1 [Bactrocera dorsalis]
MGATFANKMPKLYKLSAVVRIFILLALCGLSNAQVLYVDDFCDFAGYDGICLEASKCTDLQAKMQAMTLESHHVGRCSFGVREEIICCPKWQTPVQTPPKLPNAFIDLSKQPEFQHKSPPDGAFSDSSIPITTSAPINFPQNGLFVANPLPNVQDNQNINGNPVVDENERMNAIFGVNPEQIGNDKDEKKANSLPVVNENNNGFFISNPVLNVQANQNLNGNPALDKNERINAIFGVNPEQNGNDNNKDEKKVNSFPVVNENNNGIFIANPLLNVLDNQLIGYPVIDENDRLNAVFGVNPEQIGNDNNVVEKKGNSFPVVNENNNGFFATNPVLNVQANQNFNDNPVINENDRFNAIFGGNREEAGVDKIQEERKGNPVPVINGNNGIVSANPVPSVQNSLKLNGNPVIDEDHRLNAIFGNNLEHNSNDESKERNPAPFVNGNNNGFFSATPVPNVQGNGQFIGSPVIDVNERVKAIITLYS